MKQHFINQAIKEVEIEEFIKTQFPQGDYSSTELQRTPLGIKIVIYTNKPGRIIGKGGKNINDMTEAIKHRFNLENPQIDVKVIRNPNLDAKIVAKQIASALEKGYNYKKIGNLTLKRIIDAGAVGAQIIISGKLGGGKGMTGKFVEGYLKHCGQPAKDLVDYGFEEAQTKPGKIGVKVSIMKEFQDITGAIVKKGAEKEAEKATEEAPEEPEGDKKEEKVEAKTEKKKPPKSKGEANKPKAVKTKKEKPKPKKEKPKEKPKKPTKKSK
jgi:small subunit ribosomal protein S3